MEGRPDGVWFVRSPAEKDIGLWTTAQVEQALLRGGLGPDHRLRHVDWPIFVPLRETRFWAERAVAEAPAPADEGAAARAPGARRGVTPWQAVLALAAGIAAFAVTYALLPAAPAFDAEAHIRGCGPVDGPCRSSRASICVCGVAPGRCGCATKGACHMRTCLAVARGEAR